PFRTTAIERSVAGGGEDCRRRLQDRFVLRATSGHLRKRAETLRTGGQPFLSPGWAAKTGRGFISATRPGDDLLPGCPPTNPTVLERTVCGDGGRMDGCARWHYAPRGFPPVPGSCARSYSYDLSRLHHCHVSSAQLRRCPCRPDSQHSGKVRPQVDGCQLI